jgi:DNA-directed RNA polymerase specialized sigma24 family protein
MPTKTYDRTALSESLLSHLRTPTPQTLETLFQNILPFSDISARAHLRPFMAYWAGHGMDFANEEMSWYAIEKFFLELQKAEFDRDAYLSSPMACLNRYFKHRFSEWCRSEKNRIERHERVDVTPTGWEHTESHLASPEHELIVAEIEDAYAKAVGRLPKDLKPVVVGMRQGKKAGKISEEICIPVGKVYEARRRIKTHLRRALRAYTTA